MIHSSNRILALLALLSLCHVAVAAPAQATFYVSPNGSGAAATKEAPGSLTTARDLIRKMNQNMTGDIVVNLRGGTYSLTSPFELLESNEVHDSGTNGFSIIYQASPGETPVLSGGLAVTGWTLHDKDKNIWKARVPEGTKSRQFYVNERRAVRARGPSKPEGWTKTEKGWTITDTAMQSWSNIGNIEVVSRSSWKHLRCGLDSISGTEVTMKQPGWSNASKTPNPGKPWNGGGAQQINKVEWLENAYELLNEPGEWYLDQKVACLYYIPLPYEDMAKALTVLPILETILDVRGSGFASRIHHLQFIGLQFKYATWMMPSSEQAYANNQAGVVWVNLPPVSRKTPGSVSFQYASDIRFERNAIGHMGGAGLDFGHGPQRNAIIGNCVYDISGNGIFLGEVDDVKATDPKEWCDANIIQNNYITQVGMEYEDQVGICTGYTRRLLLDHNEIYDTPYTGISVGWGWGKEGYSHQNVISNNHVHKFMQILHDGGGIYTLGNQGTAEEKTVWRGNYIHHGGHAQGMYSDEGSGFMEITQNVVHTVGANWMNIWTKSIHDITVHGNFSDKTNLKNNGTDCVVENNDMTLKPPVLSEAAQAIANNAGQQPEFKSIKNLISLMPRVMINDSDPAIVYSGTWTAGGGRKSGDYENDVHHTGANGDSASYSFTGCAIEYVTELNNDQGEVNIYLDGVLVKTVDCNAPQLKSQQSIFAQTWEKEEPHVIKIEKKSGRVMLLDAFRVHHLTPHL